MKRSILLALFGFFSGITLGYYFGYSARGVAIASAPGPPLPALSAPAEIATRQRESPDREMPAVAHPAPQIDSGRLHSPIAGLQLKDIVDTFSEARGAGRTHEATDILAPRGTLVLAVVDGVIEKLFSSKQGGLTVYQFDAAREYAYYYAHLDRYADGLSEGDMATRGTVIGYVGTTGNAPPDTPHLHFAIFRLGPEKRWWEGVPINPYPLLVEAIKNR